MDRLNTSNLNFLRYLSYVLILLAFAHGSVSSAQAQSSSSQNVYTVIGDVQNPSTYAWPARVPVSLSDLLRSARQNGQQGTAIIRRAAQPEKALPVSVWSLSKQAASVFLTPRDTVIWTSAQGSQVQSGNVVFLTDQGPRLQPIPRTGVDLSTALQSARLPENTDVVAYRNQWSGQSSVRMTRYSSVLHGDVLDARTVVRAGMVEQNHQQPAWNNASRPRSETSVLNSGYGQPQPPFALASRESEQSANSGGLLIPTNDSLGEIPEPFSDGASDHSLGQQENTDEGISATLNQEQQHSDAELADLTNEALAPVPATQDGSSETFLSSVFLFGLILAMGLITIGIVRTRREQQLHAQMRIGQTSGGEDFGVDVSAEHDSAVGISAVEISAIEEPVVPKPLEQVSLSHVSTGQPAAGGEVELENEVGHTQSGLQDLVAQISKESSTVLPSFSSEISATKETTEAAEIPEAAIETIEVCDDSIAASMDEADREQQDASELQVEFQKSDLEDCPVLSVGLDVNSQDVEVPAIATWLEEEPEQTAGKQAEDESLKAVCDGTGEDVVEDVIQDAVEDAIEDTPSLLLQESMVDEETPILQLPDVDALRNALTLKETSETKLPTSEEQTAEEHTAHHRLAHDQAAHNRTDETHTEASSDDIAPALHQNHQDSTMSDSLNSQPGSDYLEDLIQNRLPIELTDAQLPLKVSLFGKPEGPRRLRIDGVHTTIAPPHMARTASRTQKRESAMAMSGQTVKQKSADSETPQHTAGHSSGSSTLPTDSHVDQTTRSAVRPPTVDSADRQSGLDKALNFLEEQSKS